MVGFAATSNVEAARRYGLRVAGTMAHAFVEAFPGEREAFEAFASDHPDRATFLVDTYDTIQGVRTAIETIRSLGLSDRIGVRLDSGDLDALARESRVLLDEAGLRQARIFASGGLDELEVDTLVSGGAPIDAFGIGTQMGVSADAPFVDSVYKLTEYDGRPTMKLSTGKVSAPGRKQVWRSIEVREHRDRLHLRDEPGPGGAEALLSPVMARGTRTSPAPSIAASRDRFLADLRYVPQVARALRQPKDPEPERSPALLALTEQATAHALTRTSGR